MSDSHPNEVYQNILIIIHIQKPCKMSEILGLGSRVKHPAYGNGAIIRLNMAIPLLSRIFYKD